MTSMAAALAASLPSSILPSSLVGSGKDNSNQKKSQDNATSNSAQGQGAQGQGQGQGQAGQVPQRMEGLIDPEASKAVESVALGSLVLLKILKHSTDNLPAAPPTLIQQDRNPPPTTALSSRPDALGVLLGLDLDGVLEVEDCFALPGGEAGLGAKSYSSLLLPYLRDVSTPDSPVGIYLSTRNGGFLTRPALELVLAVEKASERGKAVLLIHDAAKGVAVGGGVSVKAYTLSEGARAAAKGGKWDSATLAEHRITPTNMLVPLPTSITNPALISAFLSTLTTPSSQPDLSSPSSSSSLPSSSASSSGSGAALPPSFTPLLSSPSTLTSYLSDTLDSLTLSHAESNNVAFLTRQIAREKQKHEQLVRDREEENLKRRKQGLNELPAVPAFRYQAGQKDPNRLELLCLQGQLDGLAKGMGAEAGKGLVKCFL